MTQTPVRIALFGSGAEVQPWAWALAKRASLDSGSFDRAGAVVLGPGTHEPLARAGAALRAGLPVLWACGRLPNVWQLVALAGLSAPGGPFLRLYEPFQHRGGFGLLKRLLGGPEPLWRPSYLRTVSGPSSASIRLEDAAIEALAVCEALLPFAPEKVTAVAVHGEAGEIEALFLTASRSGGPIAQCTVGPAEAGRDELVVSMPGRTLRLEPRGLRVSAAGRADRVLPAPNADAVVAEALGFVEAVLHRDLSVDNSGRWLNVAALWWAARQSLSSGLPEWVPSPPFVETETPPFKLIEGGGRAARVSMSRRLALVAS